MIAPSERCLSSTATLSILLLAIAALLPNALLAEASPTVDRYIVQGSNLDAARSAVEHVGGQATHELEIIGAVAATLSAPQVADLEAMTAFTRVFPDSSVQVASTTCTVVGSSELVFDGRKVRWYLTNAGSESVLIDTVSVTWPNDMRKLKKIKVRGSDIYTEARVPPSTTITSGWRSDLNRRQIAPGATDELFFEFESNATTDPGAYSFSVGFAQGCSVGFDPVGSDGGGDDGSTGDGSNDPPPPAECLISGENTLDFDKNKVEWILTNNGAATARLDRIQIIWPGNAKGLKKIKFGSDIFQRLIPTPTATIDSGWRGSERDRELAGQDSEVLKFEFENTAVSDPGKYTIELDFADGCSLEYAAAGVLEDSHPTLATHYPSLVGADQLHLEGITGRGVTVAFLDTGNSLVSKTIHYNADSQWRYLAQYSATGDYLNEYGDPFFGQTGQDVMGHGSHLISAALSAKSTSDGKYNGVAPGADLVTIRAFGGDGSGYYSDVIRGIDWIVQNKDRYGIRVLNLSFSATPVSYYWDDPLNQAVMAAWQAGIAVVASAGNGGPDPMTIGVPGNVPYIITVGAMTDSYTPAIVDDDHLASFSSAGPTLEGFVKQ